MSFATCLVIGIHNNTAVYVENDILMLAVYYFDLCVFMFFICIISCIHFNSLMILAIGGIWSIFIADEIDMGISFFSIDILNRAVFLLVIRI